MRFRLTFLEVYGKLLRTRRPTPFNGPHELEVDDSTSKLLLEAELLPLGRDMEGRSDPVLSRPYAELAFDETPSNEGDSTWWEDGPVLVVRSDISLFATPSNVGERQSCRSVSEELLDGVLVLWGMRWGAWGEDSRKL